jgi:ssDNA-binding replication factor A large subunit
LAVAVVVPTDFVGVADIFVVAGAVVAVTVVVPSNLFDNDDVFVVVGVVVLADCVYIVLADAFDVSDDVVAGVVVGVTKCQKCQKVIRFIFR